MVNTVSNESVSSNAENIEIKGGKMQQKFLRFFFRFPDAKFCFGPFASFFDGALLFPIFPQKKPHIEIYCFFEVFFRSENPLKNQREKHAYFLQKKVTLFTMFPCLRNPYLR